MNEAQAGRLFKLSIWNGSEFTLICGLQATSVTINQEGVDTTDNCSGSIRQMLEGAGVRNVSISGNGVTRLPSAMSFLLSSHFAQSHVYMRLTDGRGLDLYGFMQIVSIGASAAYNGAEMFEISLESTGEVTDFAFSIFTEDSVPVLTEDGLSLQTED